ncbi:MAG: M20/M25/M40 family metallo-hydrolase [Ruegeria sp.]|uniref:M20/M25/M40 family metallo-hydrolase n=1 Tax=Ruegeria sp. TaxID=1879320 RepID=UPI00349EFAD4
MAGVSSAQEQASGEWIVLGEDAAQSFTSALAGEDDEAFSAVDSFQVYSSKNGLTAAKLDPSLENVLHRRMHVMHHRCGGYTVYPNLEQALSELDNPNYSSGAQLGSGLFPTTIDQQMHVVPALGLVQSLEIISTIQSLQDLGNRYYNNPAGQTAALEILGKWQNYGHGRTDFSSRLVDHAWLQDSVVATIQGSEHPDEIVIIGAHLDSINTRDNFAAPGADDNASGIAVVSEVLRVLTASDFRPKRTLEFMAYAAEEVGLRGSGDIAETYKREGKKVVAVLQIDMAGYRGSDRDLYFITDFVSEPLTNHLKSLISEYHSSGEHRITWGETECGYGCSDHVSWTRNGFASAFPFEAKFDDYNPNIHTERDLLRAIDRTGQHQARFAKLGITFMIELGKSAATLRQLPRNRYIYTTLRAISSSASRGCRASDWACMTKLCKQDLGASAWRGWAGCWQEDSRFTCSFECGAVMQSF